jgi:cytochrome c-type biogenesis protein CcmH
MTLLVFLLFAAIALVAASFALLPAISARSGARTRGWYVAPALGAAAVLVGGLGLYGVTGQPALALRSVVAPNPDAGIQDYPAIVSQLARAMRDRPNDPIGWTYLGQGYLAFGQTTLAVRAYDRAVSLTRAQRGDASPELLSAFGVALSMDAGEVTAQAEGVFREALARDSKNQDARYHLGMAHAQRGETDLAIRLWEPLITEASPDAPWREALFTQLAILKARSGAAPPDPQAMVASLAAKVEADPTNLDNWLLLIRSYGVLGQKEKAHQAWIAARAQFAGSEQALQALAERAREAEIE